MIHQNPERTAAAEEFYEQTPWANPNHPSHAQNSMSSFYQPQSSAALSFSTPASQVQRLPDRINGSGSTIDALSGPPSSALGPASLPATSSALNAQPPGLPPLDDTPAPMLKRVGSGASSVPPVGIKRDLYADLERPNSVTHSKPMTGVQEPFEAPPREAAPAGLLSARPGPFATVVGGGARYAS